MQAIGCFDGWFVNWVVENNVIITDHWHGITFLGMRDSRIVNNTVIDLDDVSPGSALDHGEPAQERPRPARTWSSGTTWRRTTTSRAPT